MYQSLYMHAEGRVGEKVRFGLIKVLLQKVPEFQIKANAYIAQVRSKPPLKSFDSRTVECKPR